MPDYHWKPITPLSDADRLVGVESRRPVHDAWRAWSERQGDAQRASIKEFNRRLIRRMSIETGILERLYDLDRGTTETLVAQGFAKDLVATSSSSIEPSTLIDILRDQEAAIQLVVDCVAGNRALTKFVIHEIHLVLTRHQEATQVRDQFGRSFWVPLLRGKYKEQPNNPRRGDASLHEYCPPIHVESEMDNLIDWFGDYEEVDPIVAAAWLHHRFTQIHPYQDGNGRLARALTTFVLLRARLLPVVVDRDHRVRYISALEAADRGELTGLVDFFDHLEEDVILRALDPDEDATPEYVAPVLQDLSERLRRKKESRDDELRKVNEVAIEMRNMALERIDTGLDELRRAVAIAGESSKRIENGGSDHQSGHWYKHQVGQAAKQGGKFANFDEDHYFVKASLSFDGGSGSAPRDRLVLIVSFHHVGRELSGIMEATAFAELGVGDTDFIICSKEPFVFANNTRPNEVSADFAEWIEAALAVAFKAFGDRL